MPLIVEDGTIVAGANAYVTLVEQAAFIGSIAQPTATDTELERAIILATRYIDGHYRQQWKGRRVEPVTQSLEWPRYGVSISNSLTSSGSAFYDAGFGQMYIPSDTIPQRVKDACCELALRALSGELAADGDASIGRKKIDVIDTEYRNGVLKGSMAYPVIDQLLSDYLHPRGTQTVTR
jgi:hypothetical protein